MFRFVVYSLVAVFLITLVRVFVGIILKGFHEMVNPSAPSGQPQRRAATPGAPAGGELKKDPVCGTYVSEATSVKLIAAGQTVHFCSQGCREKYRQS